MHKSETELFVHNTLELDLVLITDDLRIFGLPGNFWLVSVDTTTGAIGKSNSTVSVSLFFITSGFPVVLL